MNYYVDIERIIDVIRKNGISINTESGHLAWAKQRREGKQFSFEEHVRAMIYSQLSNQRPWKPVEEHLHDIDDIFFHYDIEKLCNTDYNYFVQKIRDIKCGNRSIAKQMERLKDNINTLRRIECKYGSLDEFVLSEEPYSIARKLSKQGEYKIMYMGLALSMEYLRNVGVDAIKPDVHIRRMLGRLGFAEKEIPSEIEAVDIMSKISKATGYSVGELDAYFWLYCAMGYCDICGAIPKCDKCVLQGHCCFLGKLL